MKTVWRFLYIVSMIIVIPIMLITLLFFLYASLTKFPPAFVNVTIVALSLLFFYGAYKINLAKATNLWLLMLVIFIPLIIIIVPMYIIVPPASIMADEIIGDGEHLPDLKIMISLMMSYYKKYNDYFSINHISVLLSEMWIILLNFGIFFFGNYATIKSTKKETLLINEKL